MTGLVAMRGYDETTAMNVTSGAPWFQPSGAGVTCLEVSDGQLSQSQGMAAAVVVTCRSIRPHAAPRCSSTRRRAPPR